MAQKRFIKRGNASNKSKFFTYKGTKELKYDQVDVEKIFISGPDSGKKGARYYVYYEDKLRLAISMADLHSEHGIGHSSEASDNEKDKEEGKGEFTIAVGPKGVRYDRIKRIFTNIDGENAKFYACMMAIQIRLETLLAENPPPGVDSVNFIRMIRASRKAASDPSKESNYFRLKFGTREDDTVADPNAPKPSPEEVRKSIEHPVGDAGIWTSFFDENCKRISNNFEYVMRHSKRATIHIVFSVSSIFVSSQNAASVQCRISEFFFKKLGTDPDDIEEYVPDQAVIQSRGFDFIKPETRQEPAQEESQTKRARISEEDEEEEDDHGSYGSPGTTIPLTGSSGTKYALDDADDAQINAELEASIAQAEAEYAAKQSAAAAAAPC